ncbi:unnamed protein product [Phaedon cochleariae]|uniref:ITPR-interacting domain-containing protein n=1 Tax=Phaedon cochleariae TaxID=80249 RepID=A0A9N9S908_PHACE|nr:unnamed protein product [Phaedon cochleariae]
MHKDPVQQWIDTIPSSSLAALHTDPKRNPQKSLSRDYSFQSDDGSHCSSVESVLELRKPNPEAVLLELGFGPRKGSTNANRIPPRFLQPSKILPHIDLNKFLEEYGAKPPEPQ